MRRNVAFGDPATCQQQVRRYIDAGINYILLRLTSYDQIRQFEDVTEHLVMLILKSMPNSIQDSSQQARVASGYASRRGNSQDVIDHIVIITADLSGDAQWLAELTGISGTYGGTNPVNHTHNMLFPLLDGWTLSR